MKTEGMLRLNISYLPDETRKIIPFLRWNSCIFTWFFCYFMENAASWVNSMLTKKRMKDLLDVKIKLAI